MKTGRNMKKQSAKEYTSVYVEDSTEGSQQRENDLEHTGSQHGWHQGRHAPGDEAKNPLNGIAISLGRCAAALVPTSEFLELFEKIRNLVSNDDLVLSTLMYHAFDTFDLLDGFIVGLALVLQNKPQAGQTVCSTSGNTEDVEERLDRGLLDFAVIAQEVDLSKYNYLELPAADTWGVVMRKDSPLAKKEAVRMKDLLNLPLICSRQGITEDYPRWFGEKVDTLNIVATFNLSYNAGGPSSGRDWVSHHF